MKKRILLALVLVCLIAYPVAADVPFRLIVDDKPIATPIINVDGTTYAPIRAVADVFNATTDWNFQTQTITIKTKQIDPKEIKRPPIKGDAEFVAKVNAALDLLEQKDFPHYWMVCQSVWGITQLTFQPEFVPDTTWAYTSFGVTFIVPKLADDSKRYVPEYLAGVIVHEACHSAQTNYDRELEEREAYAHTIATYIAIGAPQWMQNEYLGQVD
jgi:hypothetical protein